MSEVKTIGRGRRGRTLILALLAVAMVASCGARADRVTFDGVNYKARAKPVSKDDREQFTVRVPRVDRGYEGALKAGDYEAKRYCIENYGTSEIDWYRSPEDPRGTIPIENNTITFAGKCVTW